MPARGSQEGRGSGLQSIHPWVMSGRTRLCITTPSQGPQRLTRVARETEQDMPGPQRRLFLEKGCVVISESPSQPVIAPTTSLERAWKWGLRLRCPNRSSQRGQPAPTGCVCRERQLRRPQQSPSPEEATGLTHVAPPARLPARVEALSRCSQPILVPLYCAMLTWEPVKTAC